MCDTESISPLKGSCLCGEVRYEVKAIQANMAHCHCKMCRKFHGAAFSTFAEALVEDFQWLSGEDRLQTYVAENGSKRQFCGRCGSSLTFQAREGQSGLVEFSLATLDDDCEVQPDAHVFVASKVNWYEILDNLPQNQAGRL